MGTIELSPVSAPIKFSYFVMVNWSFTFKTREQVIEIGLAHATLSLKNPHKDIDENFQRDIL